MAHALQGECALTGHVQTSHAVLQELDRPVHTQLVGRKGVHPLRQPDQPAYFGIMGRQVRGDALARERRQVERHPAWEAGLELLD